MKRFISIVLATLLALSVFGATTLFSGVIGAGAVYYDYYTYTKLPGVSNFTDTEHQLFFHNGVSSGVHATFAGMPDGIDDVISYTVTAVDEYSALNISSLYSRNRLEGNHGNNNVTNMDVPNWAANDTVNGKTIMGDYTFADQTGICFWLGSNGESFNGPVRLQLFQVPCKGPYYIGKTDDGNDVDRISDYDVGFMYESRIINGDGDGYYYYDFKSDFKNTDWWSKDDDGVNRSIYGDADGDGILNGDNYYWPIPKSKIALIGGMNITLFNAQVGDVISMGDMMMYKDSRIHIDELDEYLTLFDSIDPEAYTEESYETAMLIYLEAYDVYMDPDLELNYTQTQIDELVDRLKKSIAAMLPMFKAKSPEVSIAGFEVWNEDDIDEMSSGGISLDVAMINEEIKPAGSAFSVQILGGASNGEPSYGWSNFTSAVDDGGDITAVKNVFGAEGLDTTAGLRFWIKFGSDYTPLPTSIIVGVGDSTNDVYFECDDGVVQVPNGEGYTGVSWSSFYDVNGEADIFDYFDTLDYFTIKIADCAQQEYFIADLHAFVWSMQIADFTEVKTVITNTEAYLLTIDRNDYTEKSWQRVLDSISAAKALYTTYGVDQETADAAAALITTNVGRLNPRGNEADSEQMKALQTAYYSSLDYWRGNYVTSTYARLKEASDEAGKYINDEITAADCIAMTNRLNDAISGLVPIANGGSITTIKSFETWSSRDFGRATGDRVSGIDYTLNTTFAGLPEGYAKALKMAVTETKTSEITDEHGAMQFKTMMRTGFPQPIVDDIENPNIPGDKIGGMIGDLTGSSGIKLWIGVNDVNLAQNCNFRFSVSNCSEGPIFERHSTNIPVPSTGSGWVYIPWEYFEYYDDWTNGQAIDLKEIRFYIIRVDGTVQSGFELYVTGIQAYTSPTASTNALPVISNITADQEIDVTGTTGFAPKWDVGTAALNGERFIYGSSITKNGDYTLKITNGDKSTSVSFTIVGGEAPDYELPIVNIADGGEYTVGQTVTWDVGTATLNGEVFTKGSTIDEAGSYTLVVTNGDKVVTIAFTVIEDTPPVMVGDFDGDGELTVADALAALRIAARLVAVTPETLEIGDTDGDGSVTVADALAILRVAARLATSL